MVGCVRRTKRKIATFIDKLPASARADVQILHDVIAPIMDGLPKALFVGKFWGGSDQEILGYGVHTSVRPNGTEVEWFHVGLAVQKNYLSLYINAVEDRQYLSEKYGASLGKVKVGKASLSFKTVADIDLDKLRDLITKARVIADQVG